MKRVLITGKNSYIGEKLEEWLNNQNENYIINKISLKNKPLEAFDFSQYEIVVHVAGIAHVSSSKNLKKTYYDINRDLAFETAKKAKEENVSQFIFLSSISVYGDSTNKHKVINKDTIPTPSNYYGDSKLQAEYLIKPLENDYFKIAILRPPMIYGENSKGNYPRLSNLAKITPLFPNVDNKRSMIHIDNLSEFIKLIIEEGEKGMFFPQNKDYVKTSDMVKYIRKSHGKRTVLTKIFNPLIKLLGIKVPYINKIFGNLFYEKSLSEYKHNYQVVNFEKSIFLTELRK